MARFSFSLSLYFQTKDDSCFYFPALFMFENTTQGKFPLNKKFQFYYSKENGQDGMYTLLCLFLLLFLQLLISRHWVSSKTFEPILEMKIIYWFMCIDTATHCIYIFSLFLILFVNFQKKWHWNRTCEIRRMNMWWQRPKIIAGRLY